MKRSLLCSTGNEEKDGRNLRDGNRMGVLWDALTERHWGDWVERESEEN